jgi:hypothetical protein
MDRPPFCVPQESQWPGFTVIIKRNAFLSWSLQELSFCKTDSKESIYVGEQ